MADQKVRSRISDIRKQAVNKSAEVGFSTLVDIVFVIDGTGSMQNLLDEAKERALSMHEDIIRGLKGRIHFAHVRNLQFFSDTKFEEAAHLSSDGTFDMYEIMKALYDIGFEGPIRPDHGRTIWGEKCMPGYGLYDRALGAAYLNGLWEAIGKSCK